MKTHWINGRQFQVWRNRGRVVQEHHLSYMPEETVRIFKSEHLCCTWMDRAKFASKGFLDYLKRFVEFHEKGAIDL